MNKTWLDILSFLMSFQVTPKRSTGFWRRRAAGNSRIPRLVAPEAVRVSAVQLSVRKYQNLKDYAGQMYDLAKEAAENGAQLVVFPEYVGLLAGTMLPNYEKIIEWVLDGENKVGLSGVKLAPGKGAGCSPKPFTTSFMKPICIPSARPRGCCGSIL